MKKNMSISASIIKYTIYSRRKKNSTLINTEQDISLKPKKTCDFNKQEINLKYVIHKTDLMLHYLKYFEENP